MINIDNAINNYYPLITRDVFFQKTTEVALSYLASLANSETFSPIKYYSTYQFAQQGLEILQQRQVVQNGPSQTTFHTAAVYFALLGLLSKGVLHATPFNNEFLLALLSSPTAVNQLTKRPVFQSLMRAVYQQEFGVAKKLLGGLFKEYLSGTYFPADAAEAPHNLHRQVRALTSNVQEEVQKRTRMALDTVDRVQQITNTQAGVEWEQYGLALLDGMRGFRYNFIEFTSFSPSSFLYNAFSNSQGKKGIQAPVFHERILAAWSLGAETCPILSPLLFISATPDLVEMVVRTSGVGLTLLSEQSFLSTLGTELALKIVPSSLRDSELNQRVFNKTVIARETLIGHLNALIREFEGDLRERGYPNAKIDQIKKILLQSLCAMAYAGIAFDKSPFLLAIYTEYFCTYMAGMLANHGAARPELLLSKSGMNNLPYKFFAGMTLTLSELMGLGHGMSVLLSIGATLPMVADTVALHPAYQNGLKQLIYYCSPSLRPLNRIKNFALMTFQGINWSIRLLPERYGAMIHAGEGLAALGVVAGVTQAVKKIYQEPIVRETLQILKRGANWIFNTSLKSHSATIASQFLGSTLGSLTALLNKPLEKRTVILGTLGLTTVYLTGSPTLATATIEVGETFITNESVQKVVNYVDSTLEFIDG